MEKEKIELLIEKSVDGSLSHEEQAQLSILCKQDKAVLIRLEEARSLKSSFDGLESKSFKAGFSNRVMRRIKAQKGPTFDDLIAHFFPRVAIPAFAAACLLMISNVMLVSPDTPLLDALFALSNENDFSLALF